MAGSPIKRARRAGVLPPATPKSQARPGTAISDPPELPPRDPDETQVAYLDRLGIDTICDMIRSGMMLREVARALGISKKGLLSSWISADDTRRATEAAALADAAKAWDHMAMEYLDDLAADAPQGAITRARELANHLRWRASKLGRAVYGERVEHSHVVRLEDLVGGE